MVELKRVVPRDRLSLLGSCMPACRTLNGATEASGRWGILVALAVRLSRRALPLMAMVMSAFEQALGQSFEFEAQLPTGVRAAAISGIHRRRSLVSRPWWHECGGGKCWQMQSRRAVVMGHWVSCRRSTFHDAQLT